MGETTDQIQNYIENKQSDLGSDIQELEQKVKSATDWREQFQKNPMTMVGVAFGGGILLASMFDGHKRRHTGKVSYQESSTGMAAPHAGTDHQKHKALETWDNIKGALIGVAATRVKDFIGELVPGFHEQLHVTEHKVGRAPGLNPGA